MYLIMHMFRLVKITVIEFPQIYSILSRGMNLIFLSYCIKYIKIIISITKVKQLDFNSWTSVTVSWGLAPHM